MHCLPFISRTWAGSRLNHFLTVGGESAISTMHSGKSEYLLGMSDFEEGVLLMVGVFATDG